MCEQGKCTECKCDKAEPFNCPVCGHETEEVVLDALTPDMVNHPPHYTGVVCKAKWDDCVEHVEIECIDVIEALDLPYKLGNVLKYLWRAGRKSADSLEDLKKARWYLDREITTREYDKQ